MAASIVKEMAHPDANIIWGAQLDESIEDTIRVTVVATGLGDEKKKDTNPTIESLMSSSTDEDDDSAYTDVLNMFN